MEDHMSEEFTEVRVLDNFYQTSSFFPMPVVLMSTLNESGSTNLAPYSLCFPYIVTGGKHAMVLLARTDSNTAINIVKSKVCSINFIPDKKININDCWTKRISSNDTDKVTRNISFISFYLI